MTWAMQENLFFLSEQVVFCLFFAFGLSLLLQTHLYLALMNLLAKLSQAHFLLVCLLSGFVCLPFALFLVLTHNDWTLSPSVIVTVTGWITLCKSLLLLFWPQIFLKIRPIYLWTPRFLKWYVRVSGVLYILLALLVLSNFLFF